MATGGEMGVSTAAAMAAEDRLEAGVGATFGALAWEIELAGARCLKLDALVGEIMAHLPPAERAQMMEGMHLVDLLGQQLTSLSAFARRLGEMVGDEVRAPVGAAIADMTLGALADRMAQALGGQDKGLMDGDDAGDLDLF